MSIGDFQKVVLTDRSIFMSYAPPYSIGRGYLGRLNSPRKQEHDGQRRRVSIVGKIKLHDQSNNVTIILKAQPGDNLVVYGVYSVLPPPPYEAEPRRESQWILNRLMMYSESVTSGDMRTGH